MNKIYAACRLSLAMLVIMVASAMTQPSPHGVDVEKLLDSMPISLDTYSSIHEGYQAIGGIPRNLIMLYGAMCILEIPYVGESRIGPSPSLEMDYVPLVVDEKTTLREFLDATCSDGKLAWAVIRNAIHIYPAEKTREKETYLDSVRMSLDFSGVSMLDAAKAWALVLNTHRNPVGYGVILRHGASHVDMTRNRATPPSLKTPGTVTLKIENVTAREALCAILGASPQMNWIYYHHQPDTRDIVTLHFTKAERESCPVITSEERELLNAQEDLESVLVEPAAQE